MKRITEIHKIKKEFIEDTFKFKDVDWKKMTDEQAEILILSFTFYVMEKIIEERDLLGKSLREYYKEHYKINIDS